MATIQLKRRVTGAAAPVPATANAGEPHFSVPGFVGGGPNALYIDDGTNVIPLVDRSRQVEVTGDQSIAGVKTITGTVALTGVANVTVGDGTAGQHLVKGAGAAMVWSDVAAGGVVTNTSLTGDGTAATPLGVAQATQALLGGAMVSTAALIGAGTNDATTVSPLGLRSQLGANVTTLPTTAKTVVPAITEIFNAIAQLEGVVIFAGSYNATTSQGTFNGQGGITAGTAALPAAAVANRGAYVIVTTAGAGGGTNEPAGPISVQDWLVSDGTAWMLLTFGAVSSTMAAANVSVTPTVAGADDVQEALTTIYAATQLIDGLTF
jgi:hypothetical protein